jgi:hypothetical protein
MSFVMAESTEVLGAKSTDPSKTTKVPQVAVATADYTGGKALTVPAPPVEPEPESPA